MPVSLTSYLLAAAAGSPVAGDAGFPGSSARLVCDAEEFDQQHFLDLIDRLLPEAYLRPLKSNPNAGYEIFQAQSAVAERLSTALHEVECGLVMLYAGGPQYATADVQLYRETAAAGAVTVKAGTLVSTSVGGRQFELTADAVFGASDLQVTVAVKAVAPGFEYNVRGQRVSAGAEILPGEIDTIDVALQSPSYGDPTIKVKQEADAAGGYPDWLAGHGANRGLTQLASEAEDAFRARMRSLPDTVTPAAMQRLAARVLDAQGIPWEFFETFQVDYMTCWDAPSPNVGTPSYQAATPTNPKFDPNLFYWDDAHAVISPYQNRWLSQDDYIGAFIVVVDRDYTVHDYGMAFDDPGTFYSDFIGAQDKTRGTPAFDVPDPSLLVSAAAFDGTDVAWAAAVGAVYTELQKAKVAGATAIVDHYHAW
jgi:hypothetical protein